MEIIKMPIGDIKPYPNNPRKNDDAVAAVVESIKQCGYCAPIVVDEDGVVLAGHTRLKALKKLGRTEAEVCVRTGMTEEQKKKYRLLDNKTNELAAWDFDALAEELDDLDFGDFNFDFDLSKADEHFWGDSELEDSEEYDEFVGKFEQKKTTDDCYTPSEVYNVVRNWAVERYGLQDKKLIRPFYPGGDFESEDYPEGCVVLDNPPFSIISKICAWYDEHGIKYFLFAPTLTLFSTNGGKENYVVSAENVIYENGAVVNTSFVTNLGDYKIEVVPELWRAMESANTNKKAGAAVRQKIEYPPNVCTAASMQKLTMAGISMQIRAESCAFVRKIDAQGTDESIFGGGFLLSDSVTAEKAAAEKAAAEKAAAEKAAAKKMALSDRERKIVEGLV